MNGHLGSQIALNFTVNISIRLQNISTSLQGYTFIEATDVFSGKIHDVRAVTASMHSMLVEFNLILATVIFKRWKTLYEEVGEYSYY